MSLNLATLLRESAKRAPTKPAIHINDVTLPYQMVDGFAQRFAGALRAAGVAAGEHVALMLPNVPQFTISYYGCHYAACPVVPLNVLLTADEIAYHLTDSDAAALVVWEGFYEAARAGFDRVASCRQLFVVKQDRADMTAADGARNFTASLMSATPVAEVPATRADDTAVILYTSGTTGKPKGAELSHVNLLYNADYMSQMPSPVPAEQRVTMVVLPLFHSFGQTVMQNATIRAGGTMVLMPRFEPLGAAQLIQRHKVTAFGGVPTMYFALLHHPEVTPEMLSSLRDCCSGGSPMPVEVMNAFDQKFGTDILEGYGLSETSPVASFNSRGAKKVGSIGKPIWGCEFKLIDADGKPAKPGEAGEICIKGHNVMKGYWKKPDATAEAIQDGWFRSGDIATVDGDGYYFIVDRKKDMLIRGGFNVYPREVEEVLYAHPAVAEAAVIGVPHESHGEEVKAVIALKPGASATPEEIIAYTKEHLAAYKYPRIVEIVASLPKGPTGKILKRELRSK
jgi:long-chain acyl-CoA synthetase